MRVVSLLVPVSVLAGLLLLAPSCFFSGSVPTIDCSTADPLPFDQVGAFKQCQGCHSARFKGAARQGAPLLNYDTYEEAARRVTSTQRVVAEGSMPPPGGFSLSTNQEYQLYTWYQCGKPR